MRRIAQVSDGGTMVIVPLNPAQPDGAHVLIHVAPYAAVGGVADVRSIICPEYEAAIAESVYRGWIVTEPVKA